MKHVGELAIIGLLLKAVKTSRFVPPSSLAFVAYILQRHTSRIAREAKLQLNI